jgi:uncharacterized membrane protein
MTSFPTAKRPVLLALALIVGGVIGWYAAFELTLAKFEVLVNPTVDLSCNFSLIVQCGTNLQSWQGSVFGFPNPLIGLGAFVAPIVVGVALLAGARFARWFWMLFGLGITAGITFVIWLVTQSIFVLGTLCPWCMVVWAVTIPLFWAVTLFCLSSGVVPLPNRAQRAFRTLYGWVPFLTVASYIAIALIAQFRLDVISYL